jgi:hypothetical protein
MQMPGAGFGRDWKLGLIVEARIGEGTTAMHLKVGDEGVPLRDRTPPTGRGVKIDASQSERTRDQNGSGSSIGAESLAFEEKFGVEFARSPTIQHFANRILIDSEHRRD